MTVWEPALAALLFAAAAEPQPRLSIEPCTLAGVPEQADCGQLQVLENRDDPNGRWIPIRFLRIRSGATRPDPAPLVFLAGGPGQGGVAAAARQAEAFAKDLAHRDLLFLDQRGNGGSNRLDCSEIDLEGIVRALRESASVEGLDVSCADGYAWPEFPEAETTPSS
jgi:pimeloyl-ACP methyl ester carboxylesterase